MSIYEYDKKQDNATPFHAADPGAQEVKTPKTWRAGTLTYTSGGLAALFGWLLWGDFAWSIKERAVMPVFQMLLTEHQASNTTFAFLINVLPSVIGLFLGPVISYRSDRYRSRFGRRIPFLLLTTPIAAAAMVAIAFSPELGGFTHRLLGIHSPGFHGSVILYFGLFWVIFEIATIAANAIFGAFTNDVVPQPLMGRFFGLFRAVSLIAGIIFNFWLIKRAEEHYVWLFISISLLYGVGFMAMCFKVKEGQYPPPPKPVTTHGGIITRFMAAAKVYCRECYSKPYYLLLFFMFASLNVTFMPVNVYSVPYAKSLNISMETYGYYLAITYVISLSLAYFLGSLADRFHPLRVGMAALALYAVVCLWGGFTAGHAGPFAIAFIGHGVLSGTFFTATASLTQRLYPHEKYAQFGSAGGIVCCFANVIAGFCIGIFLDYTGSIYRYTFMIGGISALISLLTLYGVYCWFKRLGGVDHYRAPE